MKNTDKFWVKTDTPKPSYKSLQRANLKIVKPYVTKSLQNYKQLKNSAFIEDADKNDNRLLNGLGAVEVLNQNKYSRGNNGFSPSYSFDSGLKDLLPQNKVVDTLVKNGNLNDTLEIICTIVRDYHWQAAEIAKRLKGSTAQQTCFNIWHWLRANVKFKNDAIGTEQLRTPSRLLHDGVGDCDDFTITAACILVCLGYSPLAHVVAFKGRKEFGHIYVVLMDGKKEIVLDCVMDKFNVHPDNITKTMSIDLYDGKGISGLDLYLMDGNMNGLNGLGSVMDDNNINRQLSNEYNRLVGLMGLGGDDVVILKELSKVDCLLGLANEPELQGRVLDSAPLIDHVTKQGHLIFNDQKTADIVTNYINGMNEMEISGIGKINLKKSIKKAGKGVKKVGKATGKGVKKVGKAAAKGAVKVVKATIKIGGAVPRTAFLGLMKLNFSHLASKLYPGSLSQTEAESKGYNMSEWTKLKSKYNKFVSLWKKIGGSESPLRKAIKAGSKRKGIMGLGAIETMIASASTLLVPLKELLKGVNFSSLFGSSKSESEKQEIENDTTLDTVSSENTETNYEDTDIETSDSGDSDTSSDGDALPTDTNEYNTFDDTANDESDADSSEVDSDVEGLGKDFFDNTVNKLNRISKKELKKSGNKKGVFDAVTNKIDKKSKKITNRKQKKVQTTNTVQKEIVPHEDGTTKKEVLPQVTEEKKGWKKFAPWLIGGVAVLALVNNNE